MCEADNPTDASRNRRSRQLRESELHGEEVGCRFGREHEAVFLRRGCARQAVFVDVRYSRMVLGQQCEDQWRRAGRQVVDVTPRQRADDHGEEDGREESGVEVDGKEKGLRYSPVSRPFDKLAVSGNPR